MTTMVRLNIKANSVGSFASAAAEEMKAKTTTTAAAAAAAKSQRSNGEERNAPARLKSAFWGDLVTPRGTPVRHEVAHNSGGAAGGKTTHECGLSSQLLRGANQPNLELEPMKRWMRTHHDMTLSFLKLGTET